MTTTPDAPTPEARDAAPDPVKMLADVVNEAKRLWHGDYQTGEDELAALQRLIDRTREVQRILRGPRTPPAGVVVWVAWEDGDELPDAAWAYYGQPTQTQQGQYVGRGFRVPVEFAKALGLAPGECARVRLTREAE